MKKYLLTALAALLSWHVQAADLPEVTFLTEPGYVPFEWIDNKTKQFDGFDIDLMNAIGEKAGFKPVYKAMEFDGIIPALQTGKADAAISAMTITDARAKVVDFSDPYYDSGLQLLVPANNTEITGINDSLANKKVGAQNGTTGYDYMKAHMPKSTTLTSYPSDSDMFMALLGGSVDAVFNDAPNVSYFAETKGKGKVKVLPTIYEGQQYGIAFTKGDKWLAPVNKALAELRADGTYQKIFDKYFAD